MRYYCYLILLVLIFCKTQLATATPPPTEKAEQKKMASLDEKIGQMIMIGINEHTSIDKNDPLLKEIAANKVGGIILYEKNIAQSNSKEQLKKLISTLQKSAETPLFISIDEEGGLVHRLKKKYGFFDMPSAESLGSINNTDTTLFYSRKLASLLSELGINLNYAPDVDLALNKDNPVIAKIHRSFSDNPEIVTKQASAFIQGHREKGVKTIIKHFPGHGSSASDTHLGIADVTNRWNIIEMIPYSNLIKTGNVDGIMTAHIVNCHLDTACLPATLSKTIITDVLRNMLGYKGVVFSDDMQMYAISKNYGLENAIKLSINAGVDVIMFANNVNDKDRNSASEIHAIIKRLVEQGEISKERIDESYERIIKFKEGLQ